jgi:hypothetical protein
VLFPVFKAIALIGFEPGIRWHYQRPLDAQHVLLARELSKRLPPHLQRDVSRDE